MSASSAPPANAPTVTGNWPASQSVADAEAISLQLINKERAMVGAPALKPAADLAAFATQWAQHMRETGFAHSANASGAGPSRTSSRTLTGECIVMWSDASMTAEQAAVQFQEMWRNHPPHYQAQINRQYTEIGVGMYHDSSGWWGVHEFGNG
ncbi:CAP domain-containing protein [Kitasatospora sp. NPDC048545]|uniref:CAP domain-containing protein n=1 Tax=Kitasatospora sp. NPDC048545 TaxID=3157208 RepID=UPI0033FA4DE4